MSQDIKIVKEKWNIGVEMSISINIDLRGMVVFKKINKIFLRNKYMTLDLKAT